MCIALITTAHPAYPYILLSNRDEELDRPTLPAAWWDTPDSHVLGGRDLQRPERGTWLAVTRQGRLAVLTNFREKGIEVRKDKSRGGMVSAYLTAGEEKEETSIEFARRLIEDVGVQDVGGFSLLFGELRAPTERGERPGLSILSNRSQSADQLQSLCRTFGETHGLSNSHFGDVSWPKVVHGELLLRQTATASAKRGDDEATLLEHLFEILSVDTMPPYKDGEEWETYTRQLRNSIFIPPVGRDGAAAEAKRTKNIVAVNGDETGQKEENGKEEAAGYGTQKQTIVLVKQDGHVVFVERTLFDDRGMPLAKEDQEKRYEFAIEGWHR